MGSGAGFLVAVCEVHGVCEGGVGRLAILNRPPNPRLKFGGLLSIGRFLRQGSYRPGGVVDRELALCLVLDLAQLPFRSFKLVGGLAHLGRGCLSAFRPPADQLAEHPELVVG
ncbi:hypothetical protein MA3A0930R_0183 [Mycobacteroides abscessus 3A-0930-R]|nr:hypothetical protein MA3A0930R_0183 [Mycobacteroides abscessus 3A-0930-R]